jgi:hypothetical protein
VAPFTLASVNAKVGQGFDNIVSLRGINYNAKGGGNWMGIDYVQLSPMPTPTFPLGIGRDDNTHITTGSGGGTNANFVQENGVINPLPGNPKNASVNQQSDNDYYFAGIYTNIIAGNGDYVPVGIVPRNEESAERAFAAADNELRYHFNLPTTLRPTNQLTVGFETLNLDDTNAVNFDRRYGIEVYFNNVLVQTQLVIRPAQLNVDYVTPPFTLAQVNAQVGAGFDNIVTLKGINYNAEGGGNWMGIDYVTINTPSATPLRFLSPTLAAGRINLSWTGTGTLEWAPAVTGPWTAVAPTPSSPYSEATATAAVRFYRLRQ